MPAPPLWLVDAFADGPFTGNPAAVCLLPAWPDDAWLQRVAAEMNQAETAFLVRRPGGFDLRWLTPTVEVDLCGHATLASAHAFWQERLARPGEAIVFHTRSGELRANRAGLDVELDFPLEPAEQTAVPDGLEAALGATVLWAGRNRFDHLVEVESPDVLRGLRPDFRALAKLPARGVIVTCRGEPPFDFLSRFFAPASGIDEAPVTGSAHCCLAAYWRGRLGKDEFVARQESRRGGVVGVRIAGDRALLAGRAVTVARGELLA